MGFSDEWCVFAMRNYNKLIDNYHRNIDWLRLTLSELNLKSFYESEFSLLYDITVEIGECLIIKQELIKFNSNILYDELEQQTCEFYNYLLKNNKQQTLYLETKKKIKNYVENVIFYSKYNKLTLIPYADLFSFDVLDARDDIEYSFTALKSGKFLSTNDIIDLYVECEQNDALLRKYIGQIYEHFDAHVFFDPIDFPDAFFWRKK